MTGGKEKTKPKTELDKKKDSDKSDMDESSDPAKEAKSKKLAFYPLENIGSEEVLDSTYNSVNKYNFILKFIYKYKYDSGTESLRKFLY